jgi:hypothetical protein
MSPLFPTKEGGEGRGEEELVFDYADYTDRGLD